MVVVAAMVAVATTVVAMAMTMVDAVAVGGVVVRLVDLLTLYIFQYAQQQSQSTACLYRRFWRQLKQTTVVGNQQYGGRWRWRWPMGNHLYYWMWWPTITRRKADESTGHHRDVSGQRLEGPLHRRRDLPSFQYSTLVSTYKKEPTVLGFDRSDGPPHEIYALPE
jgi:hypothetical protein